MIYKRALQGESHNWPPFIVSPDQRDQIITLYYNAHTINVADYSIKSDSNGCTISKCATGESFPLKSN